MAGPVSPSTSRTSLTSIGSCDSPTGQPKDYCGFDPEKVMSFVNSVFDGAHMAKKHHLGSPLRERKVVEQPPAPAPKPSE